MKRVAVIGTQGVPACYGGFESLVENLLGENCSPDIQYTVFCSSIDMKRGLKTDILRTEYKGAKLDYINLNANGSKSIIYDGISLFKARYFDVILLLGGGIPFMSLFRILLKGKIVYNVDGLSHTRDKYGKFAKWYLYTTKKSMVKQADVLVSDNKGIQDYIKSQFNKDSVLIAYGGDHTIKKMSEEKQVEILEKYGMKKNEYAISVCRVEPENNCHVVLEAFSKSNKKLLFIGNWEKSEYGRELKAKYSVFPNIMIQDPVYDLDQLYALRSNAFCYMHGHSVGGTNPSLVEAMFFGIPIIACDVVYNRATTNDYAYFFKTSEDIQEILTKNLVNGDKIKKYAEENYTWKHIASEYEKLY